MEKAPESPTWLKLRFKLFKRTRVLEWARAMAPSSLILFRYKLKFSKRGNYVVCARACTPRSLIWLWPRSRILRFPKNADLDKARIPVSVIPVSLRTSLRTFWSRGELARNMAPSSPIVFDLICRTASFLFIFLLTYLWSWSRSITGPVFPITGQIKIRQNIPNQTRFIDHSLSESWEGNGLDSWYFLSWKRYIDSHFIPQIWSAYDWGRFWIRFSKDSGDFWKSAIQQGHRQK